ncbi:MAG: hypothetical protein HXX09_05760 [Bacteroidetes bacterium]|nr:hypothetical protein [Bacteroidota bacterium]
MNILVLTYWSYNDALIQTYTLPYVQIISKYLPENSKIFLLTLDKDKCNGNSKNNIDNIQYISFQYKPFGFSGIIMWFKILIKLFWIIKKERITTIHAWCTPAGMLGYILSILTFKKLIIDSYEPHAEAMVENGSWKKSSFAFRLLFRFEKYQTKRAQHLVAATYGMKKYAELKYKHVKNNFFVKPACVNLELFSKANIKNLALLDELQLVKKIVCVYAGKFGGIYLDHEVFDFFSVAENFWGEKFRVLLLSSHSKEEIESFIIQSQLNSETLVHRFVDHIEMPNYLGLGDFAITPVKPVPTKRYCTPIKDGEYWALGLPIVITKNISEDSELIEKYKIGAVIEDLNKESYLKAIHEIDELISGNTRIELYNKIRPIAENHRNFVIAENIYNEIYSKG